MKDGQGCYKRYIFESSNILIKKKFNFQRFDGKFIVGAVLIIIAFKSMNLKQMKNSILIVHMAFDKDLWVMYM